ncbi:MAG: hypothetical protein AAF561_15780 [Planctomycetota bacterium]
MLRRLVVVGLLFAATPAMAQLESTTLPANGEVEPPAATPPPFAIPGASQSARTFVRSVFDTDFKDGGGSADRFTTGASLGFDSGFLSLDGSRPASPQDISGPLVSVAGSFTFRYHSWDLDNLGPQGRAVGLPDDLLEDAYVFSFNPRLSVALDKQSSLAAGAFLAFEFEDGADVGDAFIPGGFIGYRREFNRNVVVTTGVVAFYLLDDSFFVVPLLAINVDYGDDAFFLTSEGLGARTGYRFGSDIALSVGGEFIGNNFRLQSDGILEQQAVRLDVGVDWTPSRAMTVSARVGGDVWGQYIVSDESGREVFDVEVEPGAAATLEVRFRR